VAKELKPRGGSLRTFKMMNPMEPEEDVGVTPGHDAWIVGDKRCVLLDFTGISKYAKPA
jgi:hypothetical protein